MKFKSSKETNEFIEQVFPLVGARNKAVLGRTGLFLALSEDLPQEFKVKDSEGVDLSDETILGDDLASVARAALNHRVGKTLNEAEYKKHFRLYFEFGCYRLKQIWEDSGKDQTHFLESLLSLSHIENQKSNASSIFHNISDRIIKYAVNLRLLEDEEPWLINASGGNGLMVISGAPGRGKTQLALDLLMQLSNQGVKFLFFDLKGELENTPANKQQQETRNLFLDKTGASYTSLISNGLPINPLIKGKTQAENAQIASEMASLVRSFAHQLGANQERTIRDAYESIGITDFPNLVQELQDREEDGVALSIIEKIERFNIFSPAKNATPISKWLSKSQVIDFKPLGNDNETKSLAVAFILNSIMRQLNQNQEIQNGVQPLQMVLFVDEAHLLLPKEGKAGLLGSLARQGRSWGFPLWLASQDADAFITAGANATDFAELADCGIHFSPETLTDREQKKILGQPITRQIKSGEAVLRLKRKLSIGQARQFWKNNGEIT